MKSARHEIARLTGVLLVSVGLGWAAPTIVVQSPTNNSSVVSAVHYVASATSSTCSKGMSSIQLYSGAGTLVYTTLGGKMNTYVWLRPGTYYTTVQAWDNCGSYAKVNVKVNVTSTQPWAGLLYVTQTNYLPQTFNNSNLVQGYIIGQQGSLTANGQGPVNTDIDPESVAADKGGYRLYVGNYQSGDVSAYFINRSNGRLSPVPGSPFPVNRSISAVAVHPSGQFVFAAGDQNAPGDGITVFHVNSNGSLSKVAGSPFPTQNDPWDMVVDPSGKYLYVADASSSKIDAFSISAVSGALTPLPGSPYTVTPANPSCGAVPENIIDWAGKYAYTANAFDNSVGGFYISSAGTLSNMPGSPYGSTGCSGFNNVRNPDHLAIDGTGKFLYGQDHTNSNLSIFRINANGSLTFVKYTAYGTASDGPIRTDPAGNYLYVLGNGITGYAINHTTGDLTPLPGSPYWGVMPNTNDRITGMAVTR